MAKSVLDKEPQAKALYHAGKSLTQIKAKTGVSKVTLLKWKAQYNWGIKGEALPELERKEAVKLEAEAERHGVTKAKVFAKVGQLMDAENSILVNDKQVKTPDNRIQLGATSLAADILGMKKLVVDPSDEFRSFFSGLKGSK
jgi:uncharacterized protein YjcR